MFRPSGHARTPVFRPAGRVRVSWRVEFTRRAAGAGNHTKRAKIPQKSRSEGFSITSARHRYRMTICITRGTSAASEDFFAQHPLSVTLSTPGHGWTRVFRSVRTPPRTPVSPGRTDYLLVGGLVRRRLHTVCTDCDRNTVCTDRKCLYCLLTLKRLHD